MRSTTRRHVLLLSVIASAAVVLIGAPSVEAQPAFPHDLHLEQGLECQDCHLPEGATEPAAATEAVCLDCHEPGDVPFPEAVEMVKAQVPEQEWFFTHAVHVDAWVSCESCHDLEQKEYALPTMNDCISCHGGHGLELECAACHARLDVNVPPGPGGSVLLDHSASWDLRHGETSRLSDEACSYCHQLPDDCIACHLDVPPRDHTRLFKVQTHGLDAEVDRDRCQSCHILADFCAACHQEVTPRSHAPAWGEPLNLHCQSCHLPLVDTSCFTCHKGTPSHDQPPASHIPAWGEPTNLHCNDCHVPLADTDCAVCHSSTPSHDQPPASHVPSWGEPTNTHCNSCHLPLADTDCAVCHAGTPSHEQPPASHRGAWGQPTNLHCNSCHLPLEDTDCAVCHTNTASHDTEAPAATHTPGWGDPTNRHCDSCHTPLADTDCAVCHAGTPSHFDSVPDDHTPGWASPPTYEHCNQCHFPIADEICAACHLEEPEHGDAPSMPGWHDGVSDCLYCHPSQEPINHPIVGDDCTRCHLPS